MFSYVVILALSLAVLIWWISNSNGHPRAWSLRGGADQEELKKRFKELVEKNQVVIDLERVDSPVTVLEELNDDQLRLVEFGQKELKKLAGITYSMGLDQPDLDHSPNPDPDDEQKRLFRRLILSGKVMISQDDKKSPVVVIRKLTDQERNLVDYAREEFGKLIGS
jgi:hypothetical protein